MPMSDAQLWSTVDTYFADLLAPTDPLLDAALAANNAADLPAIDVTRNQGKFLQVLVQIAQAKRVLELGLLGGYSTIWMARGLPQGGRIISLERSQKHADVARGNLTRAGLIDRVEIRVGPALESLPVLVSEGAGPFDLIFLDADKPNNANYLRWALKLARPGTVIVVDNIVRDGKVIEADSDDENVQGSRRTAEALAAEPSLSSVVMQTVGSKGYDGFAVAVVR
jgi:predicted O-methyltransferase YrrM